MLKRHENRVHANATMLEKNRIRNSDGSTMNIVLPKCDQIEPTRHASR